VRSLVSALVASAVLLVAMAGATLAAHDAGPCNGTGADYAEHHIVPNAQMQALGPVHGHAPGGHSGFASCVGAR
jgi:hypothetical protein